MHFGSLSPGEKGGSGLLCSSAAWPYTKYANNFQLKINFMLQLRLSAK